MTGFSVSVDLATGYRENHTARDGDELLTVIESVLESKSFTMIEVNPIASPRDEVIAAVPPKGLEVVEWIDEPSRSPGGPFVPCQSTTAYGVRCDRIPGHPGDHASARADIRWAAADVTTRADRE